MKCEDCDGGLLPRTALRTRAVNLAAALAGGDHTAEQRSAFAIYALMSVGQLATRCSDCTDKRLMEGVAKVAAGLQPNGDP